MAPDSDHHAVARRWRADGTLGAIDDLSLGEKPSMSNLGIAGLTGSAAVAWQRESNGHVLIHRGAGATDVSGALGGDTAPTVARLGDGGLVVAWKAAGGNIVAASERPGGTGAGLPPGGEPLGVAPAGPLAAPPGPGRSARRAAHCARAGRDAPPPREPSPRTVRLVLRCDRACAGTLVLRRTGRSSAASASPSARAGAA